MNPPHSNTYDEAYLYRLKALYLLKNIYNINPLINKDGTFAFRRKDVETQNEFYYAFAKLVKLCGIRKDEQLTYMILNQKHNLNRIHVNLNSILAEAKHEKQPARISATRIKKANTTLAEVFNRENKIRFIKKFGMCYLTLDEQTFQNGHFERIKCGYVDLYNLILLVDNINLNILYTLNLRRITTDQNGIFLYRGENKVVSFDVGRRNSTLNIWQNPDHRVKRLYIDRANFVVIRHTNQTPVNTTRFLSEGLMRTQRRFRNQQLQQVLNF